MENKQNVANYMENFDVKALNLFSSVPRGELLYNFITHSNWTGIRNIIKTNRFDAYRSDWDLCKANYPPQEVIDIDFVLVELNNVKGAIANM